MIRIKIPHVLLILCLAIFSITSAKAQETVELTVEITFPLPGEAAQGLMQISGTIEVDNLNYYTLEFAFQESSDQSWFGINKGETTIIEGILGEWDTSSIPDGNYNLRLTVNRKTSDPIILIVEGIRVRNYTPVETNTPVPTNLIPTITPTIAETIPTTPTAELRSSPTPLASNPAAVSMVDIQKRLIQGAFGGLAIFIVFLLYRAGRTRK